MDGFVSVTVSLLPVSDSVVFQPFALDGDSVILSQYFDYQNLQRRVFFLHGAAVLWNKTDGFRAKATALNGPALLKGFSGYTSL